MKILQTGPNESPVESDDALAEMLQSASEAGFPDHLQEDLTRLVRDYRDIFRTRLGNDPPAPLPPMNIRLREKASPIQARARRYSPNAVYGYQSCGV